MTSDAAFSKFLEESWTDDSESSRSKAAFLRIDEAPVGVTPSGAEEREVLGAAEVSTVGAALFEAGVVFPIGVLWGKFPAGLSNCN